METATLTKGSYLLRHFSGTAGKTLTITVYPPNSLDRRRCLYFPRGNLCIQGSEDVNFVQLSWRSWLQLIYSFLLNDGANLCVNLCVIIQPMCFMKIYIFYPICLICTLFLKPNERTSNSFRVMEQICVSIYASLSSQHVSWKSILSNSFNMYLILKTKWKNI